jgi:hypothetical protein
LKKAIIYVHGKGGSALEAERFKKNCPGFKMIGVDYREYLPWIVEKQVRETYEKLTSKYDQIFLLANSIGVYFSMLALQNLPIKRALFISPILDMEKSITDTLKENNLTEIDLKNQQEITLGRKTLSWKYLQFVREHPITWQTETEILYGQKDDHTSNEVLNDFIENHNAHVTIMKNGEHWFHTKEQLAFLDNWMQKTVES